MTDETKTRLEALAADIEAQGSVAYEHQRGYSNGTRAAGYFDGQQSAYAACASRLRTLIADLPDQEPDGCETPDCYGGDGDRHGVHCPLAADADLPEAPEPMSAEVARLTRALANDAKAATPGRLATHTDAGVMSRRLLALLDNPPKPDLADPGGLYWTVKTCSGKPPAESPASEAEAASDIPADGEVSVDAFYRGNSVGYWHAKAKAYGDIVHGCSPSLRAAGHPVDQIGDEGATPSIRRAVEALIAERDDLAARLRRLHPGLAVDTGTDTMTRLAILDAVRDLLKNNGFSHDCEGVGSFPPRVDEVVPAVAYLLEEQADGHDAINALQVWREWAGDEDFPTEDDQELRDGLDKAAAGRAHELDIAEGRVEDWRRWARGRVYKLRGDTDGDLRETLDKIVQDALTTFGNGLHLNAWRAKVDGILHTTGWNTDPNPLSDGEAQGRLRLLAGDYQRLRGAETAQAGAPVITEASTHDLARALFARVRARISR